MVLISIPSKRGAYVNLVKPIERYIKENLGPDQSIACQKGLDHLQKLRDAILVTIFEARESTVKLIESYCDLLDSLEQRIPLAHPDIPISFRWYDCFGGSSKTSKYTMKGYNAGFDRCCMMFNIAACHSQIAKNQDTDDDSGLKIAAKSSQIAAGMFDYISVTLPTLSPQSTTLDVSIEALVGYSNVMLSQAQECIFLKAEHDDLKPNILSKLANHACKLYKEALASVSVAKIKRIIPKEWPVLFWSKASMMEIYAEYYAALSAEAEQSYGEHISRLNKTLALLKKMPRSEHVKEFCSKVEKALDIAKKDNSLIYHDTVPDYAALLPIGTAPIAKKIPVTLPLGGKPPKGFFAALVPIPVYNATQLADGIRRQMIALELGHLREATDTCNSVMASLNLPAAVQKTSGSKEDVPKSLLQKAADIRKKGGVAALRERVYSLANSNLRNKEIVENIFSTIDEEEKTDNELRNQYGARWNRQLSSNLNAGWRAEILKHRQLLKQAGQTDSELNKRFSLNEVSFDHLSGSESQLCEYIVSEMGKQISSKAPKEGSDSNKKSLRSLCNQINTMKEERADLQKQLEQITLPESLQNEFLKIYQNGGSIDAQSLATDNFNAALEGPRSCIRESINKQSSLLAKIQSLHELVFGKKRDCASALTTLLMAAESFDQFWQDAEQGITFYANLTNILVKFQNKVNDYVFARTTEKKELMKDISNDMSSEKPGEIPERPLPASNSAPEAANTAPSPMPSPFYFVNPSDGAPGPGHWIGYGAYLAPPFHQGSMQPGMPQTPVYFMSPPPQASNPSQ